MAGRVLDAERARMETRGTQEERMLDTWLRRSMISRYSAPEAPSSELEQLAQRLFT